MPTQDELERHVEDFEKQFPEHLSLPKRLEKWKSVLGIDTTRFLRLLGMTTAEAKTQKETPLTKIVRSRRELAEDLDDMLALLLTYFDYDLTAMRDALHRPVGPAKKEASRIKRRQGVGLRLREQPKPTEEFLLHTILAGGPDTLGALLTYLSGSWGTNSDRE